MSNLAGLNNKHLNSSWKDLGAAQKQRLTEQYGDGAKQKFKTARKQRMAGEALEQSPGAPSPDVVASQDSARTALAATPSGGDWKDTARANALAGAKVSDLADYDLRSFGAGGSQTKANQETGQMGKGRARFSQRDAKDLLEAGNFSAQELMDYGNSLEAEDAVFGTKAQSFLQKQIDALKTGTTEPEPEPEAPVETPVDVPEEVTAPVTEAPPAVTTEERRAMSSLKQAPQRTKPTPPSGELPVQSGGGHSFGTTDPAIKDYYLNYTHEPGDYAGQAADVVDRWTKKFDNSEKVAALDHRVNQSQLYWKSRADEQTGFYVGDMWSYQPKKFEMGDPLKAVERPDIQGMQNETMDRIESIKPKL